MERVRTLKKTREEGDRETEETQQPGCMGKPFMDMQYCVDEGDGVDALHKGRDIPYEEG